MNAYLMIYASFICLEVVYASRDLMGRIYKFSYLFPQKLKQI